jgi:alpha-methylacyl-CoA racemase
MGPLQGIRVVEFAGIGPGPFCGMMLTDMGADVVRIDRKGGGGTPGVRDPRTDVMNRGRRSIALDLKDPADVETALALVERADALIEGLRPGVMERLGLGPEVCQARNPKLVYGRMTGWGQTGPLAHAAGHDLNYIALSGALHAMGDADRPPPVPLNLVGDFGGGGMLLAFGLVCAVLEAKSSGKGQVVDAAMTEGAGALMALIYGMRATGLWTMNRGDNMLDGAAPFYGCYECADGRYVAIGSIEPQFYALLMEKTGITDLDAFQQADKARWPEQKAKLREIFKSKTRDEWCAIMEGSDVCFAPVLDMSEAPDHPHNKAREAFITIEGIRQPAPAPRFSRTATATPGRPPTPGEHADEILADWGVAPAPARSTA